MNHCPHVATVLPIFDDKSYNYAKRNIIDGTILTGSLSEYLVWAENERETSLNPFLPIVLIPITLQELEKLQRPFDFKQIVQSTLPKFQDAVISKADKATEFSNNPISLNYILVQVNEIGIDKANDIAFISHNMDHYIPAIQKFLIRAFSKSHFNIPLSSLFFSYRSFHFIVKLESWSGSTQEMPFLSKSQLMNNFQGAPVLSWPIFFSSLF